MRKNHLLTAALFVAALSSCSQDEQLSLTNEDKSVFTGSMEVIGSRTELEDNKVVWKGDETISIFEMDNVNAQYKVSGAVENGIATFEFVNFIKPEQVVTLGSNYAVYPYHQANTIDADGNISAPVSAEYTFTDRASSIATALMVAKTDGTRFNFTNAQGLICLRLNAQQPYKWGAIQSIKLTSAGKMLSGTAKMTWKEGNEAPIAVIQEGGGKELTINLSDENKKELPASQDKEYAEFYVPVVPTLFEANDLTLTVEFADSKKYEVIINKTFEVERKEIQSLKHTIGASTWEGEIEGDLNQDNTSEYASVSNVNELLKWAYTANNINNSYGLKLMKDIEMPAFKIEEDAENQTYKLNEQKPITVTDGVPSGSNWIPVTMYESAGSFDKLFKGNVDGNKHQIKGLRIKNNGIAVGFIGFMEGGSSVKNIKFADAIICNENSNWSHDVYGDNSVGVAVGRSQNGTLIENVEVVNSTVKGHHNVGGIVGMNYRRAGNKYNEQLASVVNCSTDANTKVIAYSTQAGGICGKSYGAAIIGCVNNADVEAGYAAGGIVGCAQEYLNNVNTYVIACGSTSEATVKAGGAGGLIGINTKDNGHTNGFNYIVACYSESKIQGENIGTMIGESRNSEITASWAVKNGISNYAGWHSVTLVASNHYSNASEITEEIVNEMNEAIKTYNETSGVEVTCPYTWSWTNGSWPILK